MMKKAAFVRMSTLLLIGLFSISTISFSVPPDKNPQNKQVIATVGKTPITYSELEKAFKKNMNRKESALHNVSRDSINDFLNLYVNYKLKVLDALDRGYDKDSAVVRDIETNRKVLAESFYYDRVLVEPNVKKLFENRKKEFKIAYIYISLPAASPNDTMAAYIKAIKTLEVIKKNGNFGAVARDSSDDKRSGEKGGEIPSWNTAGSLQRPVEEAAYSMKAGDVWPYPIRTRMGYIILKLVDVQPRYKVKVRHILLSLGKDSDSAAVEKKADALIASLKKGADFARLAEENSEDPSSKLNGGVVSNWYSRSSGMDGTGKQLIPGFEEAIFSLKNGQISGKVNTEYGIHIIKRDSSWDFSEDEEHQFLKKTYKRLYFEDDKRALLDSLRNHYGIKINESNMNLLIGMLDTNTTSMKKGWDSILTNSIGNKPLYVIDGKSYSIFDYAKKLNTESELKATSLNKQGIHESMNKIIDPIVFKKATANMETDYPDFKFLMDEFRDGILLFRVEALEVWDKLKFDSTKAKEYFVKLNKPFYTDHSYEMSEIYVLSDSTSKALYGQLKSGADFADLAEKNTQRAKFREKKGNWGKVSISENKLAKMVYDKGIKSPALLEPVPYESGFSIVKINSYFPPREKSFEEAIPDFAPQYQDMVQKSLTENWLNNVKNKFPVKINDTELTSIIKSLKKNEK